MPLLMCAPSRSTTAVGVLAAGLLVLTWLYAAPQTPLSPAEVDAYIATIAAQPQQPGGRHDLAALRRFLEEDDGAPFYTVNLYDYRDVARYDADTDLRREATEPAGPPLAADRPISGRDAFDRFTAAMLPLLVRQASHPVFGTRWSDGGATGWERLVIVRYRSRRDIAEIFASDAFADASAHKWAALERHDRLLVKGLQIPELTLPLVLIASGALIHLGATRLRRPSAPT